MSAWIEEEEQDHRDIEETFEDNFVILENKEFQKLDDRYGQLINSSHPLKNLRSLILFFYSS